jgi:hypothetical protein
MINGDLSRFDVKDRPDIKAVNRRSVRRINLIIRSRILIPAARRNK